MKPVVLSLISDSHRKTVYRDVTWAKIAQAYTVASPSLIDDIEAALEECSAVITGWGTNFEFTPNRLRRARNLRIILHTAGSVKMMFSSQEARAILQRREIIVYAGVEGMASNVAESTIGLLILAMRRWPEHAASLRLGETNKTERNGRFLGGATIGLVGLSTVARMTIPLLRPFNCRILAYDPFVKPADAARLGVELAPLDELFRQCDAVSLHAPALPSTQHMIGAAQLRLLRDGATLVNTARGMILDHDALYEECKSGRISVALDVTDPEPLPKESPLFDLPNVFITPHVAAQGHAGLHQIGDDSLEALTSALSGSHVIGAVPIERWEQLA